MSSKKQPHRHPPTHSPEETRPSFFSNTVLFSLVGILGALLGYAGWQAYRERLPAAMDSPPPAATATPASSPATPAQLKNLLGQWVRGEDGYVLDIKNVADDGRLDAAYLNPKPIHVAKAEASIVEDRLRVFVELRDVNYPGSTYDLRYDAATDQLMGEYFQPALQQRFPVGFQRLK